MGLESELHLCKLHLWRCPFDFSFLLFNCRGTRGVSLLFGVDFQEAALRKPKITKPAWSLSIDLSFQGSNDTIRPSRHTFQRNSFRDFSPLAWIQASRRLQ